MLRSRLGRVSPAIIAEAEALGAALVGFIRASSLRAARAEGKLTELRPRAFFQAAPTVERVAIPMSDGSLQTAFA